MIESFRGAALGHHFDVSIEAPHADDGMYSSEPFEIVLLETSFAPKVTVAGRFGSPREGGGTWKGLFIKASHGGSVKAIANGTPNDLLPIPALGPIPDAPMGPTRMQLRKPLIAAVSGHAVAGGLELALFCDLRVADADAVFGVFCRRVGVPLIDGGTVRLPQIIGLGRALDLILTGRPVRADEALAMGLINRICPPGLSRSTAEHLAAHLATLPHHCLRSDRQATLAQADDPLPLRAALARELAFGLDVLSGGDSLAGATSFSRGQFRHGNRD